MELKGTFILGGTGNGKILATKDPISFWGCVDPLTGIISDKRHELYKSCIAGKILVFPYGEGSSTGSLMILELIRNDMAPAAIINIRTEPLLTTGPVVGKHFYEISHSDIAQEKFQFSFGYCRGHPSVNTWILAELSLLRIPIFSISL